MNSPPEKICLPHLIGSEEDSNGVAENNFVLCNALIKTNNPLRLDNTKGRYEEKYFCCYHNCPYKRKEGKFVIKKKHSFTDEHFLRPKYLRKYLPCKQRGFKEKVDFTTEYQDKISSLGKRLMEKYTGKRKF